MNIMNNGGTAPERFNVQVGQRIRGIVTVNKVDTMPRQNLANALFRFRIQRIPLLKQFVTVPVEFAQRFSTVSKKQSDIRADVFQALGVFQCTNAGLLL